MQKREGGGGEARCERRGKQGEGDEQASRVGIRGGTRDAAEPLELRWSRGEARGGEREEEQVGSHCETIESRKEQRECNARDGISFKRARLPSAPEPAALRPGGCIAPRLSPSSVRSSSQSLISNTFPRAPLPSRLEVDHARSGRRRTRVVPGVA